MTKYFCDKCEKEIKQDFKRNLQIPFIINIKHGGWDITKKFWFCCECGTAVNFLMEYYDMDVKKMYLGFDLVK